MDPRFRRNHQLHLLLKKRTYVSDHELYEMMRSKQVFRAQNDLRRELESRLREIKLDQKVRVASFMVQRATFLKMMAARKKCLRHLLNVKKHIGQESDEHEQDVADELGDIGQVNSLTYSEYDKGLIVSDENIHSNENPKLRELNSSANNVEEEYFVQSVNNEWMEIISKKKKGGLVQKGKNREYLKRLAGKKTSKDPGIKEAPLKESTGNVKSTPLTSLENIIDNDGDEQSPKCRSIQQIEVASRYKEIMENDANKTYQNRKNRESLPTMAIRDQKDQSNTTTIKLPDIILESNTQSQSRIASNSRSSAPSSNSFPQHLPPIQNSNQPMSLLEVPNTSSLPPPPEPQRRERSVTMLFVEESDDEDDDYFSQVSAFDIEAFSKCLKRKRGYSIIISSIDLRQELEKERIENNKLIKKNSKKTKMSVKYPHHPSSWGVKAIEEISPRQRSNQWYQNFVKAKTSKHLHTKTSMQRSNDPEFNHRQHREDENSPWKTPSSSDSHLPPETLYQLKLERLKQQCQLLSQRVALFVSS